MSSPPRIEIKRGDTLALDCQALSAPKTPQSLAGWTIRAQIRDRAKAMLADLMVTIEDAAEGRYVLTAGSEITAAWATGPARMDIEYTDPGDVVQSTETLIVDIIEDVTR
jgi:hypothetical protein